MSLLSVQFCSRILSIIYDYCLYVYNCVYINIYIFLPPLFTIIFEHLWGKDSDGVQTIAGLVSPRALGPVPSDSDGPGRELEDQWIVASSMKFQRNFMLQDASRFRYFQADSRLSWNSMEFHSFFKQASIVPSAGSCSPRPLGSHSVFSAWEGAKLFRFVPKSHFENSRRSFLSILWVLRTKEIPFSRIIWYFYLFVCICTIL